VEIEHSILPVRPRRAPRGGEPKMKIVKVSTQASTLCKCKSSC